MTDDRASGWRTNEPGGLEVEGSTAGATGGGDLAEAEAIAAIVKAIRRLPQVTAGWAFGVPPEAAEEWLWPVAEAAYRAIKESNVKSAH